MKVGRVSSPTANVTQRLEKVNEADKVRETAAVLLLPALYTSKTNRVLPLCVQLDRLLQLLVQEQASASANMQPFPLTIVFVERKVRALSACL